jgi:excisionase family DNA binding protein
MRTLYHTSRIISIQQVCDYAVDRALLVHLTPYDILSVEVRCILEGGDKQVTTDEATLTTEELAGWLKVDPRTVRTLVAEKKIPVLKVGRVWRFTRVAVAAALTEGGPAPEGQPPSAP